MSRAMIHVGNVLDVLPTLPDGSVRCCVTSPPYWGLRDYGTAQWEGGLDGCSHAVRAASLATRPKGKLCGSTDTVDAGNVQRNCYCGARRIDSQMGLEPTPDAYVANMVQVFREVRRVLADDGTLWLNLGDSYARSPEKGVKFEAKSERSYLTNVQANERNVGPAIPDGLKQKDMVGIPWRVAFSLQADGWCLRSDVIWSKPNPMPESVTDRPTKAHEYLFLLAKSERYYYNAAAIAEPFADERMGNPGTYNRTPDSLKGKNNDRADGGFLNNGNGWNAGGERTARNARTVWTIPTQPYPEAHFATFPEELPRRCILAGSAPGDTVLDPFAGSGTTLAVAIGNGRNGIGIELNPEYADMARRRIGPMFCEVAA